MTLRTIRGELVDLPERAVMGSEFLGSELKRSYWTQCAANLEYATQRSDLLFQ
jgi:hypothetical protein